MSLRGAILVTGAASGIGRAAVQALCLEGTCQVHAVDNAESGLTELAQTVRNGTLTCHTFDVSDPAAWAAFDIEPPLNGAVLCAGIAQSDKVKDMDFADWQRVIAVNLNGAFLALQWGLRRGSEGASLVAVSSATGRKAAPMTGAYGASKAGLSQLVRVTALEAAADRIRVNAVAPGGVKTPMFRNQTFFKDLVTETGSEAAAWTALASTTPIARFAEPEEIAATCLWLLAPETAHITGAVIDCDGGYGL